MANKTKKEKLLDDLGIKNSDNVVFMTEEELKDTKVVDNLSNIGKEFVNDNIVYDIKEDKLKLFGSSYINENIVPKLDDFNDKYEVITFKGKGILGLNEELSLFKGQIVSVISFKDELGIYVLQTLCLV